jgi:hypothetical protein
MNRSPTPPCARLGEQRERPNTAEAISTFAEARKRLAAYRSRVIP